MSEKDKPVVGHVVPVAGPGEKRSISVRDRITISEDVEVKTGPRKDTISASESLSAPAPHQRKDHIFLQELLNKYGGSLSDGEAAQLRELIDFLTPAVVENDEATGLNRWNMRDWGRRARQTGMEKQNERTVLDLLNILSGFDIPFYVLDAAGHKTGKEYSTSERLQMLYRKVKGIIVDADRARLEARLSDDRTVAALTKVQQYETAIAAARGALKDHLHATHPVGMAVAETILDRVLPKEELHEETPADDRGVRRVTIDAREVVLRLCMQRIVHDLAPGEVICKHCRGLGLVKDTAPYRLGAPKPHEDAWPYHHQWLRDCPACYMGKALICEFCKQQISRGRTQCQCKEAVQKRTEEAHAKEMERRKTVPRIALADYKEPMVWCDECHSFVQVDSLEDHCEGCFDDSDPVEDRQLTTFFACYPTDAMTTPVAADIMEALQNAATEEAHPEDGDEMLDFSKDAEVELDTFLKHWATTHVTARSLWYADMNLIVEVSLEERGYDVAPVSDLPDADAGGGSDGSSS